MNIKQAAYVAMNRKASVWLQQINSDLPYGDISALVDVAKSQGCAVTQIHADMFLVDNSAWIKANGCISPI